MKKILCLISGVIIITSCITQKPLYTWNNYDITSYNYLKSTDEKSKQELIENYQAIIEKQKGSRNVPPPGICADYGFILLQSGKTNEGKALLAKEISLYPESKIFIERILKMLEDEKK